MMIQLLATLVLAILGSTCVQAAPNVDEVFELIFKFPCKPNCLKPEETLEQLKLLLSLTTSDADSNRAKSLISLSEEDEAICKDLDRIELYEELLALHEHNSPEYLSAPKGSEERFREASNSFNYIQFHRDRQFKICSQVLNMQLHHKASHLSREETEKWRDLQTRMRRATNMGGKSEQAKWQSLACAASDFWMEEADFDFPKERRFVRYVRAGIYNPTVEAFIFDRCERVLDVYGDALNAIKASKWNIEPDEETKFFLDLALNCDTILRTRSSFRSALLANAMNYCSKSFSLGACFSGGN